MSKNSHNFNLHQDNDHTFSYPNKFPKRKMTEMIDQIDKKSKIINSFNETDHLLNEYKEYMKQINIFMWEGNTTSKTTI